MTFILKFYVPVWFEIKCIKYINDESIHLYRAIETSRYLLDGLKNVVFPVIVRNSFFVHPKNLLMSMVFDKRRHINVLRLRSVLNVRKIVLKVKGVKNFITSTLNFDAAGYTELIFGMMQYYHFHQFFGE